MKNLLVLFLLFPLKQVYAQEINTNINNSSSINVESGNIFTHAANMKAEGEGIHYLGQGIYYIQQTANTDVGSYKRQVRKAKQKIESFAKSEDKSFEILNEERRDVKVSIGVARTIIKFKLLNKDGTPALNEMDKMQAKNQAKKELLELQEFLELGIITKDDFDKKAEKLKKILLDN